MQHNGIRDPAAGCAVRTGLLPLHACQHQIPVRTRGGQYRAGRCRADQGPALRV